MTRAEPWTVEEIPQPLRRRFQSPSGEHLLFFLWPARPVVTDRRALAWERELDEISRQLAATGVEHRLADEPLIIGWIYRLVASDGPWLLTLAAAVVFLMLLLDLRSLRRALLVVTPMAVGVALLEAVMFRAGLELNMFNMVVVPSVLGIGIDNAVHIYHRYRSEAPGSIRLVVRQTGMAATLASVTTAVGFGSSLISDHVGLRSLGFWLSWASAAPCWRRWSSSPLCSSSSSDGGGATGRVRINTGADALLSGLSSPTVDTACAVVAPLPHALP